MREHSQSGFHFGFLIDKEILLILLYIGHNPQPLGYLDETVLYVLDDSLNESPRIRRLIGRICRVSGKRTIRWVPMVLVDWRV